MVATKLEGGGCKALVTTKKHNLLFFAASLICFISTRENVIRLVFTISICFDVCDLFLVSTVIVNYNTQYTLKGTVYRTTKIDYY